MKPKIAVVLGSGGHTRQMLELIDKLGHRYDYNYIIANTDKASASRIRIPGKVFYIYDTRLKTDANLLKIILKYVPSTLQAINVLWKIKPVLVIGCGPAVCEHVVVLAKYMFGAKAVFFESLTRVKSRSISGKQLAPFFTDDDLFLVQWKPLLKQYANARFVGRLS
ncbi:hypothetical protein HOD83_02405 [Candidatus Woesearchaeota archaeon]|jgi:UDP-N-acetylglucosamine:LPS N-acetylglucosamine transferase|nr:hypothetical protein [Candidatus Woesearchaeota archaeon]MBT4114139.1 hypothetical protein [Candidatus Woesearchaeota archaeon]MBT4248418.1 hypothetical protein [Candidatus Woesearchaeota archaeon]